MEQTNVSYVKLDANTMINENCIRWVKKLGDCLEVCAVPNRCNLKYNLLSICKADNLDSYNKLNKHFE